MMLLNLVYLVLLVSSNVETAALSKRATDQVMGSGGMKQFAGYISSKFSIEEYKLHQLTQDLFNNLKEITEIAENVKDEENAMLEKVKCQLNKVIKKQIGVRTKIHGLAGVTAEKCEDLIQKFKELLEEKEVEQYREILDKMANLLTESYDTLTGATSEIKRMSEDMSKIMAHMGFFNAMIQRVKEEVDSKDSFEAVATNILVPLSSIIINLVEAGEDEGDEGSDDGTDALLQELPAVLNVGESIIEIANNPVLVERLNDIHGDFNQTQKELEEESDVIEEERSRIYKWRTEVRNLRGDYGNNLQELHMNNLIDDLLQDDIIPDFIELKKASEKFLKEYEPTNESGGLSDAGDYEFPEDDVCAFKNDYEEYDPFSHDDASKPSNDSVEYSFADQDASEPSNDYNEYAFSDYSDSYSFE